MTTAVASHTDDSSTSLILLSNPNSSSSSFPEHDEAPLPSSSSSPAPADDDLDVLAARAAASPSSFLRLLSLLRPRLQSFSALSAAEPTTSRVLSLELHRVEEHFSKLKLSFLHLEAKQKMLAWMASNTPVPAVDQQQVEDAEVAIQEGKKEIAQLKARVEEREEQVDSLLVELSSLWSELEAAAAVMGEQWEEAEWEQLSQLMADLGETDPAQLCSTPHLEQLLAEQRSTLSSLTSDLADKRHSSSTLQAELSAVSVEADRLEAELASLTSRLQHTADPSPTLHFLTQLASSHTHLTGVRLSRPEHNQRCLLIHLHPPGHATKQAPLVIEVDCNPSAALAFNGARLVSGGFDAALWDDIVDYAVDTQDLPFLVNEVMEHMHM